MKKQTVIEAWYGPRLVYVRTLKHSVYGPESLKAAIDAAVNQDFRNYTCVVREEQSEEDQP